MKTLAACLFTSVLAADNGEPLDFSIPLRETVGEGKTLFFADRTLNKRSSDKPKTMWSLLTDSLFSSSDHSHRTKFDKSVDKYLEQEQMLHDLKQGKSRKMLGKSIAHDINYAVTLPMFIGEIRMGSQA